MMQTPPQPVGGTIKGQWVPQFTWPEALIFNETTRTFAGYVMQRLDLKREWRKFDELILSPASSLRGISERNFARLAAYLAGIYAQAHLAGYRIVDGNTANFYVHRKHFRVCAIDCDNYALHRGGKLIHTAEGVGEKDFYSCEN